MTHPGDLAARSSALAAVALVLVNDHVLKARYGNWFTGKLSDAAGVFVLPLIAISAVEVGRWGLRRSSWRATGRELLAAVVVTGVGFAAVKVVGPVGDVYASAVGTLRWTARSMVGGSTPHAPIEVTRDWTDVVVLPVLAASWLVARHRTDLPADTVRR